MRVQQDAAGAALPGPIGARTWPAASAVLELFKPITWFPPMWAFACGAVSASGALSEHWPAVLAGIVLAGPLVCAMSQAVNDWYDRDVDALNEPHRPIPSGRMPGRWGLGLAVAWTLLSLALAAALGRFVFVASLLGIALAWAYSAPPFRLKRNGWIGNAACGFSYEGLTWVTGAALLSPSGMPSASSFALAALYSLGSHGIMTLNDFKSIRGDRQMGIASLPVLLGPGRAASVACLTMALPQVLVVGLLLNWGRPVAALAVAGLLLGQGAMMWRFQREPIARALWYSGAGVPLFVAGMMVSAFAVRLSG